MPRTLYTTTVFQQVVFTKLEFGTESPLKETEKDAVYNTFLVLVILWYISFGSIVFIFIFVRFMMRLVVFSHL